MSKRVVWSITFILLAIGVMLVNRSMISGLIATAFLLALLLIWAIPSNPFTSSGDSRGPGLKQMGMAVLGIGLGLFASITAVLVLPPQVFPWVLMAVGIGLFVWYFVSHR